MEKKLIKYSTVLFDVMDAFDISANEFILVDIIHKLSTAKGSKRPGWFYGSRQYLADCLRVSKRTIQTMIPAMEEKGFLVRDQENDHLATTEKWENEVTFFVARGVKNFHGGGEEISPNNNNDNNTLFNFLPENKKECVPPVFSDLQNYFCSYGTAKGFSESEMKKLAETFFNHYEARGWIPKGYTRKMKSWKAAVHNWVNSQGKFSTPAPGSKAKQSDYMEEASY